MLTLTVYGGVAGDQETGEIGGNKILVEWDDRAEPAAQALLPLKPVFIPVKGE